MPRPRGDIRERLLESARELFLQNGVDGSSLRAIASGASTNTGMVHYYFETKNALFLEVIESTYGGLLADIEAIMGDASSMLDRLEALSNRIGSMSDDELDTVRIVARELLLSGERRQMLLKRFEQGHIAVAAHAVMGAVSSGELRRDVPPPVLLVAAFASMVMPQAIRRAGASRDVAPFSLLPEAPELAASMRAILESGIVATHDADRPRGSQIQ